MNPVVDQAFDWTDLIYHLDFVSVLIGAQSGQWVQTMFWMANMD